MVWKGSEGVLYILSLFMHAEDFPCLGLEWRSPGLRQQGQCRLAFHWHPMWSIYSLSWPYYYVLHSHLLQAYPLLLQTWKCNQGFVAIPQVPSATTFLHFIHPSGSRASFYCQWWKLTDLAHFIPWVKLPLYINLHLWAPDSFWVCKEE